MKDGHAPLRGMMDGRIDSVFNYAAFADARAPGVRTGGAPDNDCPTASKAERHGQDGSRRQ